MRGEPGLFDIDERLKRLEGLGDPLLGFARGVDFEIFRPELEKALAYASGTEGGRPPLDCVMMFKVLVVQAANNLSDDRTEFLINDRLSFMRFLGLTLADKAPDAKTIWAVRERLPRAGAITRQMLTTAARNGSVRCQALCSDSDFTRAGYLAASHMPVAAPSDSPETWACSMPTACMNAAMSSANISVVWGPSGLLDRPAPRRSTVKHWKCLA